MQFNDVLFSVLLCKLGLHKLTTPAIFEKENNILCIWRIGQSSGGRAINTVIMREPDQQAVENTVLKI